jgi:hypothetical protein
MKKFTQGHFQSGHFLKISKIGSFDQETSVLLFALRKWAVNVEPGNGNLTITLLCLHLSWLLRKEEKNKSHKWQQKIKISLERVFFSVV